MATDQEFALFSFLAYTPPQENRIDLPGQWVPVISLSRQGSGLDGFGASVFKNTATNEYVIAFRGTDFELSVNGIADWTTGNGPAFVGTYSSHIRQAIEVVADVQNQIALTGGSIKLTGHSLGGGLAGVVGVFFNLQAVVFATAPFEESVLDRPVVEEETVDEYFSIYQRYVNKKIYGAGGVLSDEI